MKGKITFVTPTLLTTLVITPFLAHAQWLASAADGMLTILGRAVPVLVGIALIVFAWGVVVFIKNSGNEQVREEVKKRILWGLIILFVIISIWGLVSLIQTLLGVGNDRVDAPFVDYVYE